MPSEYASASAVASPPRVTARTSAVVETQVALWMLTKHSANEHVSADNPWLSEFWQSEPTLAEHIRNFWTEELVAPEWLDLYVLAQRSGTLFDQDIVGFIDGIEAALGPEFEAPGLATESAETKRVTIGRLTALAESSELRDTYRNLIRNTFEALRPRWEREGRAQAEERAAWLTARLAQTDDLLLTLPPGNIARNEVYAELMERLIAENDTVIVPNYFGGRSSGVLALPGLLLIVQGLQWELIEEQRREDAKLAAKRFKILSDPTRLAILARLTDQPTSIRDLSRRFELSQPTVSTHVKMLREANLLESTQVGNLTLYRASGAAIRQWLADGVNTVFDNYDMAESCPIVSGEESLTL